MRIQLSGDTETIEKVSDAITSSKENVIIQEKHGTTGEHIVEFVITYGPAALSMIKTSLDIYFSIKKARAGAKLDIKVTDDKE